jgi:hypothetical protein
LVDAKTVATKNDKDKCNHYCVNCQISGHTQDVCTYKMIPLKGKCKYMIGIPPKDEDDTEEFGVDSDEVAQTD